MCKSEKNHIVDEKLLTPSPRVVGWLRAVETTSIRGALTALLLFQLLYLFFLQINFFLINEFYVFIGPIFDHSLLMSMTN